MSCSIHLEGKNQIIDLLSDDEEPEPLILKAIIKRLQKQEFPGLRNNLKIVLTNVAELPRGFSDITNQLIEKIDILDEVYGPRAVKPLHNFLPKLSDWDKDLELDDPDEYFRGQAVVKALSVLFKKYQEEAAQVAVDETINFAEKLAPFINPNLDRAKEVFACLYEILPMDPYNCHILNQFLIKHGDVTMKGEHPTTIKQIMAQDYNEILELTVNARILQ